MDKSGRQQAIEEHDRMACLELIQKVVIFAAPRDVSFVVAVDLHKRIPLAEYSTPVHVRFHYEALQSSFLAGASHECFVLFARTDQMITIGVHAYLWWTNGDDPAVMKTCETE
jgi:GTP cyclohydrolase II